MLSTAEAAREVGISKNTLLRWISEGLFADIGRDKRGWRVWSREDVQRLKDFQAHYRADVALRRRSRASDKVTYRREAAQCMARTGQALVSVRGSSI